MIRKHSLFLLLGSVLLLTIAFGVGRYLWLQRIPDAQETPTPAMTASLPEEAVAAVQLSTEEQQRIGVELVEIRRESLNDEITAIGRVAESESALRTVSSRYGGRVEHLFINFTGQPVQVGDPIASITITGQPVQKDEPFSQTFSPGLIAAKEEYQFALENQKHAHASSRPDAAAQADALVEASRIRLERWGLTPEQLEGVVNTSSTAPPRPIQITLNSTASGILRTRKVTEGQYVNPGDTLMELTDLGIVWVMADVFDTDIGRIRPGLSANVTSEALPDTKLRGEVTFIDPHSDTQSRTTPVRIQLENPGTRLRPGMIVQTSFQMPLGSVLTVPQAAVIDAGKDRMVYVARENGIFERQSIHVGSPVKDRYPILDGLKAGDKVVTNGAFLIDSQTRLTGGLTGMFGGSKSFSENAPATTSSTAYKLTFRTEPDPPQGAKENTIHISLTDASGKPVPDAQVRLTFTMPAMPAMNMPEMKNSAELKWTGSEYVGPMQIMMAGGWNVGIEARRGNELLATSQAHINAR
jgi:Cu(I)/Ag(I) efflux system membrane fusion protein/cobalt-zinc-cadmium efflux system membrane fusion protein